MIESISAIAGSDLVSSVKSMESTPNIGNLFMNKLQEVDSQIDAAAVNLEKIASGESVSTHEMMIMMEQAKMQLTLVVEVRNKLVEAYQEVSRMQI